MPAKLKKKWDLPNEMGKKFIATPTFVESPPFWSKTPQLSRKNRLLSLAIRPQKGSTLRRDERKGGNNNRKPMKPPLYARIRALSKFRFLPSPFTTPNNKLSIKHLRVNIRCSPAQKTHILLFDLYNINMRRSKGEGILG